MTAKSPSPQPKPKLGELSPEQKRCMIAEACGWNYAKLESYPKRRPKQFHYVLQHPSQGVKVISEFTAVHADPEIDDIRGMKRLPDYLADLNAMHEAERPIHHAVDGAAWSRFTASLRKICAKSPGGRDPIHATATQRADALLICLNLATL